MNARRLISQEEKLIASINELCRRADERRRLASPRLIATAAAVIAKAQQRKETP